jgi:hypothetical protein
LVALGVFWFVWSKVLKRKFSGPAVWAIAVVILVAPWMEELWIAYNFGQLCSKDAGIFIKKTVEVDGFYDSTMRSAYENTKPGHYRFIEQATEDRKGFERVQRASEEEKSRALAWYADSNPSKESPKDRSIFYQLNEKETVAVLPNGVDAWRITKLDKPTARYQYRWPHMDRLMSHKVDKIERVVSDNQTEEVIARETKYRRQAPWFYIGLDRPVMLCPAPGEHPLSKHGSVFNLALKPKQSK